MVDITNTLLSQRSQIQKSPEWVIVVYRVENKTNKYMLLEVRTCGTLERQGWRREEKGLQDAGNLVFDLGTVNSLNCLLTV